MTISAQELNQTILGYQYICARIKELEDEKTYSDKFVIDFALWVEQLPFDSEYLPLCSGTNQLKALNKFKEIYEPN